MPRTLAHALFAIAILVAQRPVIYAQTAADPVDEYPSADRQEGSRVARARQASRMTRWLAEDPFHPDALTELFGNERYFAQAMRYFDRVPDLPPARIEAVLWSLWRNVHTVTMGEPRGYPEVVKAVLPRIRARLASLPRETAAPIAAHLLRMEHWLARDRSDADLWDALGRLIAEYPGTETSLLAEVDLIAQGTADLPQTLVRLEQFARDHAGTSAAANALQRVGFLLVSRTPPPDARGANHLLVRLLRIDELVKELESGRYPRSEWTLGAAALMERTSYFSDSIVSLNPDDVDRVIGMYRSFVRAHVAGDYAWTPQRLGEFVVRVMGPLFGRRGDRIGSIEAALTELETLVTDRSQIRLVLAEFYVRESRTGNSPAERAMADKAQQVLASLAAENAQVASRRALAELASRAFAARDYDQAKTAFEAYLARYADSDWSWLAAIHLGDTLHAQGDNRAAADAYRHPAIVTAADPVVRAIAGAQAAAGFDRLGLFSDALEAYRRSLAAADTARLPVASYEVGRDVLTRRIREIERSQLAPRGDLIERGRWALLQGRPAEARMRLEEFFAVAAPPSAARDDARVLLHRAMLEQALILAVPGNPQRDDTAAMTILNRLVAEPYDFEVGAAGMARAALLLKAGQTAEARAQMAAALDAIVAGERAGTPDGATTEVANDVAAIHALLRRPIREIEGISNLSRLAVETYATPVVVMDTGRSVTLATGEDITVRVRRPYPGARWVLYLTLDQYRILERVIGTAGRNKPRARIPLPSGFQDPDDGPPFWDRFFPPSDIPLCDGCPFVGSIEFLDAERTQALASVALSGSASGWLVMRKVDGEWRVLRLSSITRMARRAEWPRIGAAV